jgi:hypothetical protein
VRCPLDHPGVELDGHAAWVNEPQPALHLVLVDIAALFDGDASGLEAVTDHQILGLCVERVRDALDAGRRTLFNADPVMLESTGEEGGRTGTGGHIEADKACVELDRFIDVCDPDGDVAKLRNRSHGHALSRRYSTGVRYHI